MKMYCTVQNKDHPEWGWASIPLPIPDDEYAYCISLLEQLKIGSATASDCCIGELHGTPATFDVLKNQTVNIDELDFLTRSIDRYWGDEHPKFEAMAYKLGFKDIKDLINLSFSTDCVTIITSFDDLAEAGRDHYIDIHGGCASTEELDALDGESLIRDLIATGKGVVTPYGVVFDNGMELKEEYAGQNFPVYYDKRYLMEFDITPPATAPEGAEPTTMLLPTPEERLERLLERAGYTKTEELQIVLDQSELSDIINSRLSFSRESLMELNRMCQAIEKMTETLGDPSMDRLTAAVLMAEPEYAMQVRHLAENLELFEFIPNIKTPEELGRFMIQQSGHFEYDPNLEGFYDYAKYGEQRVREQAGEFNELGYISYHGTLSIDELMLEDPAEAYRQEQQEQGQTMGGMV